MQPEWVRTQTNSTSINRHHNSPKEMHCYQGMTEQSGTIHLKNMRLISPTIFGLIEVHTCQVALIHNSWIGRLLSWKSLSILNQT